MKVVEADDEIGLTNHVTAGSGLRKAHSIGSGSEDNVHDHSIVMQSSFVQTTSKKRASILLRNMLAFPKTQLMALHEPASK